MAKRTIEGIEAETGSDNVFADLGLAYSDPILPLIPIQSCHLF